MRILRAEYISSAVDTSGMIMTQSPEIAIAGRSNVGKSSFINYLLNNKKLARTSSAPGRTRMLNYFSVNDGQFFLVDLPGYGYAKASGEERDKWARFIDQYFTNSLNVANVFVLLDIRHEPSVLDIKLINYLYSLNLPFTVIAAKCDKVSKAALNKHIMALAKGLKVGIDNIYPVSALKDYGRENLLNRIDNIIEEFNNPDQHK